MAMATGFSGSAGVREIIQEKKTAVEALHLYIVL
jgi:hypothetical protein